MLSIVIPVKDRPSELMRALGSLNDQTCKEFEVIVVDDGSEDPMSTHRAVMQFYDLNITEIYHLTNLNGAAARNTGASSASCKYIAFLDADDVWLPEKVQHYLYTLGQGYNFIYSKFIREGKGTGVFPEYAFDKNIGISEYLICEKQSVQTSTICLDKRLFEDVKFDETLWRFQDYGFMLSLVETKKHRLEPFFIDKALTVVKTGAKKRISDNADPVLGIHFEEKYAQYMTQRALSYFKANRTLWYVFQKYGRRSAIKYFIENNLYARLNLRDYAYVLIKGFLGNTILKFIKKFLNLY